MMRKPWRCDKLLMMLSVKPSERYSAFGSGAFVVERQYRDRVRPYREVCWCKSSFTFRAGAAMFCRLLAEHICNETIAAPGKSFYVFNSASPSLNAFLRLAMFTLRFASSTKVSGHTFCKKFSFVTSLPEFWTRINKVSKTFGVRGTFIPLAK